jgi:thioredoxin reductase/ferredoxin
VAVVGAGPAGLAAAGHLDYLGHGVTIFEAAAEAGGMALLGVPRFRLSHEAIQRDLRALRSDRVEFRPNTRIGADVTLDNLRKEFDAVFVATGTMRLNALDIAGSDLGGVVQAIPFIETANLGGFPSCGKRVAVLGGGYTAMDAARTAIRLGAENVTVLYRRTRSETEVHNEELEETLHEGVNIEYLVSPLRFVDDGRGALRGVECVRNRLGEPDASGRPRPLPIAGSEFVFDCDMAILALGQSPDPGAVDREAGSLLRDVDPETSMTSLAGVFSGGDFVSGASTIIEAVGAGKAVAASIHGYLQVRFDANGLWTEPIEVLPVDFRPVRPVPQSLDGARHSGLALDVEVEQTFSDAEARAEGMRCLFCGLLPTIVIEQCTACVACVLVCPVDAIHKVAVTAGGSTESPSGGRDVLAYQIAPEECIRCGRCLSSCPTDAIVITDPD